MSAATLNGTPPASPFKMTATAGGEGSFDLCPSGSHPAILVGIVDLGTHEDEYQGKRIESRRVAIVWELPAEIRPNGEPFVLAKEYNLYFSPNSKLRQMIEGWRGKKFAEGEDFDLSAMLGKACLVNVVHKKTSKGKDVHEVSAVSNVPKGTVVPAAHHDEVMYTTDDGSPDLPDWLPFLWGRPISDIIKESHEMTGKPVSRKAAPATPGPVDDDSIPF